MRRRSRTGSRPAARTSLSTRSRQCACGRRSRGRRPCATSTRSSSTWRRREPHEGSRSTPEWYGRPVFYFSNPAAIYGPGDEISFPAESSEWDYELEVAAVIGAEGRIAGFTILNDWSARDLQRAEMTVGLGPAKGKDFATSLGPVLVTPDELGDLRLEMTARINGEERSRGNLGDIHWPFEELAAHAAESTRLVPGDVLGSGTVGTGCILEHGDGRWLRSGDEVELEVEGIGVLRNRVR